MIIRNIRREEMLDAFKVRTIAFSFSNFNEDEKKQLIAEMPDSRFDEEWGCYTEEGKLVAAVRNNNFTVWYDGHQVRMGGIGGVACLPEYRYGGSVKNIMKALLEKAREDGEVLSSLFPFSHEFYRKVGYEMCLPKIVYEFPTTLIADYKHRGFVRRLEKGDSIEPLREIYRAYASKYNMMVDRVDDRYHIGEPYVAHQSTMILGDERGARAYLYYAKATKDNAKCLEVRDIAFIDAEGFRMVLGFLSRMSADYKWIRMSLPEDVPLSAMVPRPYELSQSQRFNGMARVTNVEKALELMKRPAGAEFTIEVEDAFLPVNSGVYRVTDAGVEKTEGAADISMSVQALATTLVGYIGLDGLRYRGDVRIQANEEQLKKVFVRKPCLITDDF